MRLSIGTIRRRALGEGDADQVMENGNRSMDSKESLEGSERLQGLQSIGTMAMQGKERRNTSIMDGNGNSDAPSGPIQFDAPLLGHKIMVERLNKAIEPPPRHIRLVSTIGDIK
ncbi:hypothetical protein BPAE_0076g00310 [Botrytis paeoniae]|uniref:Uncharacterized protein n=1 Tax=Botrytis paeoniae TaxID=278948 RepID=A0A4Z1FPV1_9HELO|nr:hypothetical protein BPAE_0076g00310 [Botrytis paeoniae]